MTDLVALVAELRRKRMYSVDANGCWIWLGKRGWGGYGQICINRITRPIHRVFYEERHGPIPDGLVTDHLCRNILCVNPAHLEIVTSKENTLRGIGPTAINARKTHCKRGHPLSGDNLFPSRKGWRICKTCQQASNRKAKAKQKALRAREERNE